MLRIIMPICGRCRRVCRRPLELEVLPDAASGYNLHLLAKDFSFTPEKIDQASEVVEGHAHLYINGKKILCLYGPWVHLPMNLFAPGGNAVRVSLNDNMHRAWARDGAAIVAEIVLDGPETWSGRDLLLDLTVEEVVPTLTIQQGEAVRLEVRAAKVLPLPLPLRYYLAGAGFAVAASFGASFFFLRDLPKQPLLLELALPFGLRRLLAVLLRGLGLLAIMVLLLAAFAGPDNPTDNLATVTVWVIWWVGFFLMSALLLDIWKPLDLFRGLYLTVSRLLGRDEQRIRYSLPDWAGWMALAGLLAISWIELISDRSEDPRALGVLILAYAGVSLTAGMLFGLRWFQLADPLGRMFALLGRMTPLSIDPPRRILFALPTEGLSRPQRAHASEVAFVTTSIGVVLFDGISETPLWASILNFVSRSQSLRASLLALQDVGVDLLKLIRTLGLLASVLTCFLAYRLLALAMSLSVGRRLMGLQVF